MFAPTLDTRPSQGFRCITPLNISMDTSSPIPFLNQEEWLDIDELSPSIPNGCFQDVETMDLLDGGHRKYQDQDGADHEVPMVSDIPYPTSSNMIQNSVEYINSVPLPLFNIADVFNDAELASYDSAVESLSECSSLSGWSDSESRELTRQIGLDGGDCSFASSFNYPTNPIDEGYEGNKGASRSIGNNNNETISPDPILAKKRDTKAGLKRPKNGFIRFAMKFRRNVADEHPNLDNREISRILGVRWRKLSMREKYAYESEFHQEMADRKRSHPDWKYGGSRLTHELHPMEPIPSRLRPRDTLKRRAIPRLTRPYRRRKLQTLDESQRWVQCDRCNKWRKLPKEAEVNVLPEKWYCEMNTNEENNCSIGESFAHIEKQFGVPVKLEESEEPSPTI